MLVRMLVHTTYILGGRRVTLRPGDEVDVPDDVAVRWCGRRKPLAEPVRVAGDYEGQEDPAVVDLAASEEPEPAPKRRRKKED